MNPREVAARAKALGYELLRQGKHGPIYQHTITAAKVQISGHRRSDVNAWKHEMRDLEKGANASAAEGGPSTGKTTPGSVAKRTLALLHNTTGPLTTAEVDKSLAGGEGPLRKGATNSALSLLAKKESVAVVRLDFGLYVYDQELHDLPRGARDRAIGEIVAGGASRVYADCALREKAIHGPCPVDSGLRVAGPVAQVAGPKAQETGAGLPEIFELVAKDAAARVLVIRDESGRLWLARGVGDVEWRAGEAFSEPDGVA